MSDRVAKLTNRTVAAAKAADARFIVWDEELKGFGLRVETTGVKSYVVRYRVGGGRRGRLRQVTLGRNGALTPDKARAAAKQALASVTKGEDPMAEREAVRKASTIKELADQFLKEHAEKKLKERTGAFYRWQLERYVLPKHGNRKAIDFLERDVSELHLSLADTPTQANRVLSVLGSLYSWADRRKLLPEGFNPTKRIERFPEQRKERYLTREELDRLGSALRRLETHGRLREGRTDKRAPRKEVRDVLSPHAAAALRLLLFTGARSGEILNLRWEEVDLERQVLLLPDSKTGAKVVLLNPPALTVLATVPRIEKNPYVIAGTKEGQPLYDLNKPWKALKEAAGLSGVRLHDLRHTFASYGAGMNLGLPVIGKLLGHTQAATTARYSHLADDPLRRASQSIAGTISAAMGEGQNGQVVRLKGATR